MKSLQTGLLAAMIFISVSGFSQHKKHVAPPPPPKMRNGKPWPPNGVPLQLEKPPKPPTPSEVPVAPPPPPPPKPGKLPIPPPPPQPPLEKD